MIRLLRLAAITVLVGGLAMIAWSLPWRRWLGSRDLALLPERQTDFVFSVPWALELPPLVLPLVDVGSAALALLALARIAERLESMRQRRIGCAEAVKSAPSRRAGSMPIWNRLASARLLRIAAVAVIAAGIAAVLMPYLWLAIIWWHGTVLHDTYYVIEAAGMVALLALQAIAALVLVGLARIIDRLDDIP